jgi:hypothetical protein
LHRGGNPRKAALVREDVAPRAKGAKEGTVSLASITVALLVAAATAPVEEVTVDTAVVVVDGRLDEALWQTARRYSAFLQRDPVEGAQPTERTEVLLAFGRDAVYVGARLTDSTPGGVVARLARRDQDVVSDGFIVYLDPRHDLRTGAYFALNAAGTKYDGTLSNDDWRDDSWDPVWEGTTRIDGDGWTAEMRIPFSQLRFSKEDHARWGINFERIIARKNEHDLLVFTPRRGSGFVSRFVEVEVPAALTPPRRLELLPYASVRSDYLNHSAVSPLDDQRMPLLRAGVDLKLGLSGSLTLDATVFPDFGQVEVDPAVVNLSDVETFFPERRPFFIEGSEIFNQFGRGGARGNWTFNWPGADLVYSRRIGRPPQGSVPDHDYVDAPPASDIIGAAKLTGRSGGWTIGTLHAITESEHARYLAGGTESRLEVEPFSYYGLARVQRELDGGRYGLGLLSTVTARRLDDPHLADELSSTAVVGGADGWSLLGGSKMFALTAWVAGSRVQGTTTRITALQKDSGHYFQRPDASHLGVDERATHLDGWAGRVALNKQHGNVIFNSAVGALSPGWEVNDLGFGAFSDVINAHVGGGYQWPDPGKLFRRIELVSSIHSNWDFGGNHVDQGYWANFNPQFLNYWWFRLGGEYNPGTVDNRATRGGPLMLSPQRYSLWTGFDTDDRKRWRVGAGGDLGGSALADNHGWGTGGYLELRPLDRLTIRLEPSYSVRRSTRQYLDTLADPTATATYGNRYLFGELRQRSLSANLRLNWIFTPTMSIEVFAQPLVSSVHYARVLQLARPRSLELVPTDVDPDQYSFTFTSLRSSAVFRWEYRPGSTLFLVWNQNRSIEEKNGLFQVGRSLDSLGRTRPDHIFMVKATYWWSP